MSVETYVAANKECISRISVPKVRFALFLFYLANEGILAPFGPLILVTNAAFIHAGFRDEEQKPFKCKRFFTLRNHTSQRTIVI